MWKHGINNIQHVAQQWYCRQGSPQCSTNSVGLSWKAGRHQLARCWHCAVWTTWCLQTYKPIVIQDYKLVCLHKVSSMTVTHEPTWCKQQAHWDAQHATSQFGLVEQQMNRCDALKSVCGNHPLLKQQQAFYMAWAHNAATMQIKEWKCAKVGL